MDTQGTSAKEADSEEVPSEIAPLPVGWWLLCGLYYVCTHYMYIYVWYMVNYNIGCILNDGEWEPVIPSTLW